MAIIPTVNDVINQSGFGWFSFKLTIVMGMFYVLNLIQFSLPAIISPYIKCQWNMTSLEASLVSSCVMLGAIIGASFFGRMGDLYGRKLAMYLSLMVNIYFNGLCVFTQKPVWYGLSRMFTGIGLEGSIANVVGYSCEFFPMKYRAKFMAIGIFMSSVGGIYTNVTGYLVLNDYGWKVMLLLMLFPSLLLLLSIKWTPESVRYLQTSGQSNATEKIMTIFARILSGNGKMMPQKVSVSTDDNRKRKIGGISMLFGKKYRNITFSMAVILSTYMMTYFGTIFLSVYAVQHPFTCRLERIQLTNEYNMNSTYNFKKKSNIIINNNNNNNFLYKECHEPSNAELLLNLLLSLSEMPGNIFFFFAVDLIGRKWSLCFAYAYAVVVYSLQNICLPRWFNIFLLLSGRAIIAGSAIAVFPFMTESFPTIVRTTGSGLCTSCSHLAMMFVPILFQDLIYSSFTAVILIFVVFNVVSFCICLTLPDTTDKHLDDT